MKLGPVLCRRSRRTFNHQTSISPTCALYPDSATNSKTRKPSKALSFSVSRLKCFRPGRHKPFRGPGGDDQQFGLVRVHRALPQGRGPLQCTDAAAAARTTCHVQGCAPSETMLEMRDYMLYAQHICTVATRLPSLPLFGLLQLLVRVPSSVEEKGSARCRSSSCTQAVQFGAKRAREAQWRGVRCLESRTLTSARRSSRKRTMSMCPLPAATCSAAKPDEDNPSRTFGTEASEVSPQSRMKLDSLLRICGTPQTKTVCLSLFLFPGELWCRRGKSLDMLSLTLVGSCPSACVRPSLLLWPGQGFVR